MSFNTNKVVPEFLKMIYPSPPALTLSHVTLTFALGSVNGSRWQAAV